MLVFYVYVETIYKEWRPNEADGPESSYSILVKKR